MKQTVVLILGLVLLTSCAGPTVTDDALQNCYDRVLASVTIPADVTVEQRAEALVKIREICADEADKNPEQFQSTYGN